MLVVKSCLFFLIYLQIVSHVQLKRLVNFNQKAKSEFFSKKTVGTTKNIQDIFIGRCYNFLNKHQNSHLGIVTSNYNCNTIWSKFFKAIISKKPCNLQVEDFHEFLGLVNHSIPENLSVFWSGTYQLAHECRIY